jgi:hypothetical protein
MLSDLRQMTEGCGKRENLKFTQKGRYDRGNTSL